MPTGSNCSMPPKVFCKSIFHSVMFSETTFAPNSCLTDRFQRSHCYFKVSFRKFQKNLSFKAFFLQRLKGKLVKSQLMLTTDTFFQLYALPIVCFLHSHFVLRLYSNAKTVLKSSFSLETKSQLTRKIKLIN